MTPAPPSIQDSLVDASSPPSPRICILHQALNSTMGGAASVCAWTAQALGDKFRVTLATPDRELNVARIDRLYGTHLARLEVSHLSLPEPLALRHVPIWGLKSLKLSYHIRCLQQVARRFDLVISTVNEIVVPIPTIQYIHHPIRHPQTLKDSAMGIERVARLCNGWVFRRVSRVSPEAFVQGDPVCVANSQFTARAIARAYGLSAHVVYPPIAMDTKAATMHFPRSPGLVWVGRPSPEKRPLDAIKIADSLQADHPGTHLHMITSGTNRLQRRLRRLADCRQYVFLHESLSRDALGELFRTHQFGLHTAHNEHFGMAVAEMVASGMVVFAHDSGGPIEVLAGDTRLLFKDIRDATLRIASLLHDKGMQADVKAHLHSASVARSASPQMFMNEIQRITSEALSAKKPVF